MTDWNEIKHPFSEALIAAFKWDSLARVLSYRLDRRLDRITAKSEGFDKNVDDVIADAVRNGWLEELAQGALDENETHARLKGTVPPILEGVDAGGKAYYQGVMDAPLHEPDAGAGRQTGLRAKSITSGGVHFDGDDVHLEGPVAAGDIHQGDVIQGDVHYHYAAAAEIEKLGLAHEPEMAPHERAGQRLPIFSVPHRRNRNFSGREARLSVIEQRLAEGETMLAIAGLGGLGKTQLALEFCYRMRDAYELVYWLKADEAATLGASLVSLAQVLDLAEQEISDQKAVRQQLLEWLARVEARWLLIYDNADTIKPKALNDYLPHSGNGHVIITTRNPQFRSIARVMVLGSFKLEEAATFLQQRSGRKDQAGAEKLAKALGKLPLALEHAAVYVDKTRNSFAAYQEYFEQHRQELWAETEIEPPSDYHATIRTTWELSLEQLKEKEEAIQLLELCSFLAPEDIPLSLLRSAIDVDVALPDALRRALEHPMALDKAIAGLLRFSLLARADDTLAIHRLVQAVMRDRLGAEGAKEWAAIAVRLLLATIPDDYYTWHTWREEPRLLTHAAAAVWHADRHNVETEQVALLYNEAGTYLLHYGDYVGARQYLERALALRERELGPEHTQTAASLNDLGALLQEMGAYEEAQPYLERALSIREEQLGPEHLDTAESLNNLGILLKTMGAYEEARPYYERALAIWEAQLGPDHPCTATGLNNLGMLLKTMGAYEEAQPYYERALEIDEKQLGPDHPVTATSLNNLGLLLKTMGTFEEARLYYERALAIREEQLGPVNPSTATSLNNLGMLLQAMGAYEEARSYLERALAIREEQLGPVHPSTAASLNNLGMLLKAMGAYEESRPYLERALVICEEQLGPVHPRTATSLNNLGTLLREMGASEEARPCLERALAIREEQLGPEHPHTEITRHNLEGLVA